MDDLFFTSILLVSMTVLPNAQRIATPDTEDVRGCATSYSVSGLHNHKLRGMLCLGRDR